MQYLDKVLKILGSISRLRNIFMLIILTRLLFLEPNQLALIAEIIGGVLAVMTSLESKSDDDFM